MRQKFQVSFKLYVFFNYLLLQNERDERMKQMDG